MKKFGEVLKKNSTLYFYKYSSKDIMSQNSIYNPINIKLFKPSIFKLKQHKSRIIIYIFWYLITFGKYLIFYVTDKDDNIIHFSHVLPKFFKFPFMKKEDFEIGPCWTQEKFRGKNIYPNVLTNIISSLSKSNRNFYIMTNSDNLPSQRGIEKAGFHLFAKGEKTRLLGIYKLSQTIL